jgi:hypothetical protein
MPVLRSRALTTRGFAAVARPSTMALLNLRYAASSRRAGASRCGRPAQAAQIMASTVTAAGGTSQSRISTVRG